MSEQLQFFKGLESALPTTYVAGALYHCTDTGHTYLAISTSELKLYSTSIGKKSGNGEIFNDYVNNTVGGSYSHAEGHGTTASKSYAHAEGFSTTASGENSHAEGANTIASGDCSHAEGNGTIISYSEGHAQGRFNIDGEYLHVVGNGDNEDEKSNAHTLDENGNAWFAGDVYVGSTSGTNKDAGSKKLATLKDIDDKILIVTVTMNGNTGTASHSGAEIEEALEAGKVIILNDYERFLSASLHAAGIGTAIFYANGLTSDENIKYSKYRIESDKTVTYTEFNYDFTTIDDVNSAIEEANNVLIVTVGTDNIASHSPAQIQEAYRAGKLVYLDSPQGFSCIASAGTESYFYHIVYDTMINQMHVYEEIINPDKSYNYNILFIDDPGNLASKSYVNSKIKEADNIFIVTATLNDDGETGTASHNGEEIKAAYDAGKFVVLRIYGEVLPLQGMLTYNAFFGGFIYDSSHNLIYRTIMVYKTSTLGIMVLDEDYSFATKEYVDNAISAAITSAIGGSY